MKFLLGVFLLINLSLANQFVFKNLDKAVKSALKVYKPILLIIYSSNCPHCYNYFNKLQRNQKLTNYIRNNYIVCLLDITSSSIPSKIPFNGIVPFTDVLFSNGDVIAPPITGDIPLNYLGEYLQQSQLLFYKIIQSQGGNYGN